MDQHGKERALETALEQIERQFGSGAIMKLDGEGKLKGIKTSSTGSIAIDKALGVGGLPKGRVVEIFGPEAGGKTTLALHCLAQVQKEGGIAAFIDVEHALDPTYATNIGVNIETLYCSQPASGEEALEITERLIRSGAIDVIVLDSVAALVSRAEIEGAMGDSHVGLQARLMSQALRKLTSIISKTNTICIFINQVREKVGIMFGNPEITPGGRALKFYSSLRLEVRKSKALQTGDQVYGHISTVKVVKNKVAPPFKKVEVEIIFGEGISRYSELLNLGAEFDIVKKTGSWYAYGEMKLGQGKDNARLFLKENQDIANEIEEKIRAKVGLEKRDESTEKHEPGKNDNIRMGGLKKKKVK
ncbi:recombinase RecA [Candidatus Riflebacteria bacterium]